MLTDWLPNTSFQRSSLLRALPASIASVHCIQHTVFDSSSSVFILKLRHAGLLTYYAPLRDCRAVTHTHKPSCKGTQLRIIFAADLRLRFRMRRAWMDIAGLDFQDYNCKLSSYLSWFASFVLCVQADSHARVRKRGAPSLLVH